MWSTFTRVAGAGCAVTLLAISLAACSLPAAGDASAAPTASADGMQVATCSFISAPYASPAPPQSQADLYATDGGDEMSALAPTSGAIRWCDQFSVTGPPPPGACEDAHCVWPPQPFVGKPLLADGVLYLCVSGVVDFTFALNASDGTLRWRRATACAVTWMAGPDDLGQAIPALADGVLFSGAEALDAATGAVRWRLPTGVTPVVAAGATLYAYTKTTKTALSAWSARSGKRLWQAALPGRIGSLPIVAGDAVILAVVGAGGASGVYALDAATGKALWRQFTGDAPRALATANGVIYATRLATAPTVLALDAATGAVRWRYDTAVGPTTAPLVWNGVVYVAADAVYALDAAAGALRWRLPLAERSNPSGPLTNPTLAHGILCVGFDGWAAAISLSARSELWHRGLGENGALVAAA